IRRKIREELTAQLLSARMDEIRFLPNPPLTESEVYTGNFGTVYDYLSHSCVAGEEGIPATLEAMVREHRRIASKGFTQTELDVAKAALLKKYETAYKERDKTESAVIVEDYVYHFLEGTPAAGPTFNYEFVRSYLPEISLEAINLTAREWFVVTDLVIIATGPQSLQSKIPTAEKILELRREFSCGPIEPYREPDLSKPIVSVASADGNVDRETAFAEINAREWTLSNGARVVLKPTDFKSDEVVFHAFSPGGYSLHENHATHAKTCAEAVGFMGAGNYNEADLSRKLAGKKVRARPYVEYLYEGIRGRCSGDEIEDLLQLVHAFFTQARRDEKAFEAWKSKKIAEKINAESDPEQAFYDTIQAVRSGYHPVEKVLGADDYKNLNLDRTLEIYRQRFADASDFVFVFVGSFQTEKLKTAVEKYIGSLPSKRKQENWKDLNIRPPKGKVRRTLFKGTEEQAKVFWHKSGRFRWSPEDTIRMYAVQTTLDLMFTESMRKKSGGTYGTYIRLKPERHPQERFAMNVYFGCAPANVQSLVQMAENDVKTLCEQGPSDTDMKKTLATLKREAEVKLKENDYWAEKIVESYKFGLDPRRIPKLIQAYDALNPKEIQNAARTYFADTDEMLIVRLPAPKNQRQ
ncbi:MAG: insulinase family protein, partial [Bacteroidia bacterium]|nr:insulinase family protein [Bacteroidia bacterium]